MKVITSWIVFLISLISGTIHQDLLDPMKGYVAKVSGVTPTLAVTPTATMVKTTKVPSTVTSTSGIGYTGKWGVAQQIGEHTWTMQVGMDKRMSTVSELLDALNTYRQKNGSQKLVWNQKLADYAKSRAESFDKAGKTDSHAGFKDFLDNQDGYNKLGFDWLGENISYGFRLEGVHLIEWMYAGDKPHDDNQRNPRWDHVGIGIVGTSTCLIFATSPR